MPIPVACASCGARMSAPDEFAGKVLVLLLAGVGAYFVVAGGSKGGKGGPVAAGGGPPAGPQWSRLDGPDGSFVAYFPGGPAETGDMAALVRTQGGDPATAAT